MRRRGGTLVLGSATPRVEHLYNCDNVPAWHWCAARARERQAAAESPWWTWRASSAAGTAPCSPRRLQKELFSALDAGQKAVLLLNQRGFAKFLLCRDCGFVPACPHCATSLTYHEQGNVLVATTATIACPRRPSAAVRQPLPEEVRRRHAARRGGAARLARGALRRRGRARQGERPLHGVAARRSCPDAGRRAHARARRAHGRRHHAAKGAHQRLLEEFAQEGAAVLLGTQMIAKGSTSTT